MGPEKNEDFMRVLRASPAGATMTPAAAAATFTCDEHGMKKFREALEALHQVGEPTPAQLRRIALLTEIVHDDATARPWWELAADAGDEDARNYLEELRAEEQER